MSTGAAKMTRQLALRLLDTRGGPGISAYLAAHRPGVQSPVLVNGHDIGKVGNRCPRLALGTLRRAKFQPCLANSRGGGVRPYVSRVVVVAGGKSARSEPGGGGCFTAKSGLALRAPYRSQPLSPRQNPYFSLRSLKAGSPPSITRVIASRISGWSIAPLALMVPAD